MKLKLDGLKKRFRKKPAAAPATQERGSPIQVLLGYLADVSEKDAAAYALAIAAKHVVADELAWYGVRKYQQGYAYEVHEGGAGKAYLPAILAKFDADLAGNPDAQPEPVYIQTAVHVVRVEHDNNRGLVAMHMPESVAMTDTISPSGALKPVVATGKGVLLIGAVLLFSGLLALTAASFGRYRPYAPKPQAPVARVDLRPLPWAQWHRLTHQPADQYVTALVYKDGVWSVKTAKKEAVQ